MSIIQLGPTRANKTLQAALAAMHNGDTLEADPGTYTDQTGMSALKGITIRCPEAGARAHFHVNRYPQTNKAGVVQHWAKLANDKGILLAQGAAEDWTIDGIELSGAYIGSDNNGAGLRFQGKNLTVRNSKFWDCQNGLMTSAQQGFVWIEDTEFANCGETGGGLAHNVYIGICPLAVFTRVSSHDAHHGHLLKLHTGGGKQVIYDCDLKSSDDADTSSFQIDAAGGDVFIVGNRIRKGAKAENHEASIRYSTRRDGPWPSNSVRIFDNVMESAETRNGAFIVIDDTGPPLVDPKTGKPTGVLAPNQKITGAIDGNQFFYTTRMSRGKVTPLQPWRDNPIVTASGVRVGMNRVAVIGPPIAPQPAKERLTPATIQDFMARMAGRL